MEISNSTNSYTNATENKSVEEVKQTEPKKSESVEQLDNQFLQDDVVLLSGGHNGDSPKSTEK
ncbi:hypothetical protein [Pseudoalteromonas ruthenica]|uniref:hypothetical protein n=1 Tax=Pseudoalteromonas ruthenica TaxID=151081 RepID=UPI00110BBAE0|nr:hypothetical protein [Pseudoalteromonas ruthenica]TMO97532.1 hypothetical protein CWC07_13710 [Pseudoalteromonas ruthenica]